MPSPRGRHHTSFLDPRSKCTSPSARRLQVFRPPVSCSVSDRGTHRPTSWSTRRICNPSRRPKIGPRIVHHSPTATRIVSIVPSSYVCTLTTISSDLASTNETPHQEPTRHLRESSSHLRHSRQGTPIGTRSQSAIPPMNSRTNLCYSLPKGP